MAGKEGKNEDQVRTVERGSIYSIHPESTQLLHGGGYYSREEGIQTAGIAQSAGSNWGEKWEGANRVTALNVL